METAPSRRRPLKLNLLLRRLHGYAGLLTAPTLLFFAFTGILQVLGLHEARDGYTPPALVAAMGLLHKDQVLSKPGRHRLSDATTTHTVSGAGGRDPGGDPESHDLHPHDEGVAAQPATSLDHDRTATPPAAGLTGGKRADHARPRPKLATNLLKAFVIAAAVVLIVSTLFGAWMGLQDRRRRTTHLVLLVAGVVIPALLVIALR